MEATFFKQEYEDRIAFAKQARKDSHNHAKSIATNEILDVTPQAIEEAFLDSKCQKMIHGPHSQTCNPQIDNSR